MHNERRPAPPGTGLPARDILATLRDLPDFRLPRLIHTSAGAALQVHNESGVTQLQLSGGGPFDPWLPKGTRTASQIVADIKSLPPAKRCTVELSDQDLAMLRLDIQGLELVLDACRRCNLIGQRKENSKRLRAAAKVLRRYGRTTDEQLATHGEIVAFAVGMEVQIYQLAFKKQYRRAAELAEKTEQDLWVHARHVQSELLVDCIIGISQLGERCREARKNPPSLGPGGWLAFSPAGGIRSPTNDPALDLGPALRVWFQEGATKAPKIVFDEDSNQPVKVQTFNGMLIEQLPISKYPKGTEPDAASAAERLCTTENVSSAVEYYRINRQRGTFFQLSALAAEHLELDLNRYAQRALRLHSLLGTKEVRNKPAIEHTFQERLWQDVRQVNQCFDWLRLFSKDSFHYTRTSDPLYASLSAGAHVAVASLARPFPLPEHRPAFQRLHEAIVGLIYLAKNDHVPDDTVRHVGETVYALQQARIRLYPQLTAREQDDTSRLHLIEKCHETGNYAKLREVTGDG